ncbi:HAMP domain-containing protein [Halobacteriales archaeon QH_10_67_22]|nr:MAG: HAMP domain-containing protein [Halobacteriales archaeon QH_10_67_22]
MSDSEQQVSTGILPGFIARSFLAKFVIALLIVSLLIGGVSALTFQQTEDQLTDNVRDRYTDTAQDSASQIREWQQSRIETARLYSQFEVIQSGEPDEVQSFLVAEASRLPADVYQVHYVDLNSANVVASTSAARQDSTLNTREAPWQNEDLTYGDDEVFVSDAEEVHRRSIVSYVSPVEDGNPDTDRVIIVMANFDEVASDLPTPTGTQGVYSQVVDSQGRIVAGTQALKDIERNNGELETYSESEGVNERAVQRGLSGETGFLQDEGVRSDLRENFVVAYTNVPNQELAVITHVPTAEAFALRDTVTQNLAVLAATTFLGLGIIAVVFGRRTVTVLNRLTEKAEALEAGNLEVDLEATRADEFGTLTLAFASMRDALREQITEAEQARKEAEVSRAEAMEMNNYLQETAQRYSDIMQACARGDLTQRMSPEGENDAMDQIANNFNEMLSELEMTTGQLKSFAEEVEEGGSAVQESAQTVRSASEQVASSVQEISDDAYEQRDRMERLSREIEDVSATIESFADDHPDVDFGDSLDKIREVAELIDDAADLSNKTMEESESVAGAAEEQAAELTDVSSRAEELTQYAQYLGEGLNNFETEQEHEFVFQTGVGSTGPEEEADD